MEFWSKLKQEFLDFLFPLSREARILRSLSTAELWERLPKAETSDTDVSVLFSYHSPLVKALIWEIKYRGNKELCQAVAPILNDLLKTELAEKAWLDRKVLLIPMPMSRERRLEKGFNQTETLARSLLNTNPNQDLTLSLDTLYKNRHTEKQALGNRQERLHNLGGSMSADGAKLQNNPVVVLIDDVVTTGATFTEAKRALHKAGARRIICLALAH